MLNCFKAHKEKEKNREKYPKAKHKQILGIQSELTDERKIPAEEVKPKNEIIKLSINEDDARVIRIQPRSPVLTRRKS